jgi:hypothetical protein
MAEFIEKLAFWRSDPMQDLAEDLRRARGDADALALLPYDDGTFFIKPCNFDKNLIGGQGGYETVDGDKIVLDGDGEPVKSLLGVDILLALDPTEHAGAVAPIKSAIAQKHNIGEWVKADREGNIIEVGEALVQADGGEQEVITERAVDIIAQADGFDEDSARDLVTRADGYAADGGVAVGLEGSMVETKAKREQIPMEQALAELEADGEVTKIYDLAPAAAPVIDDEGTLSVDQATHIAVDQSKAADLMPTTTSTTELNTALDKARMEEHDPGIRTKYLVYGVILGTIITVVVGGLFVGLTAVI